MKFKNAFLEAYLNEAPVPLAFERAFECLILSQQEFPHPILVHRVHIISGIQQP